MTGQQIQMVDEGVPVSALQPFLLSQVMRDILKIEHEIEALERRKEQTRQSDVGERAHRGCERRWHGLLTTTVVHAQAAYLRGFAGSRQSA